MLFPLNTRPAAMAYQARVRTKPDLDSVLLPIGSGLELPQARTRATTLTFARTVREVWRCGAYSTQIRRACLGLPPCVATNTV